MTSSEIWRQVIDLIKKPMNEQHRVYLLELAVQRFGPMPDEFGNEVAEILRTATTGKGGSRTK